MTANAIVADHASCPVLVVRDETAAVHRMVGIGPRPAASSSACAPCIDPMS